MASSTPSPAPGSSSPRPTARTKRSPPVKVITIGDAGVGKTRILACYAGDEHLEPGPTIGVEALAKTLKLASGKAMRVQLWDTAGQERYRAITRAHFRRVRCATLVYDITRYKTLTNAQQWLDELREETSDAVVLLVGNKLDLADGGGGGGGGGDFDRGQRQVSTAAGIAFAKENGLVGSKGQLMFTEISALDPASVHAAFAMLFDDLTDREEARTKSKGGGGAGGGGGGGGVALSGDAASKGPKKCCQ
eukprot:g3248.t1